MKLHHSSLLSFLCLFLVHCSGKPEITPTPDYDQVSRELMQTLAPQLVGTWTMRQVQVSFQRSYQHAQIPLTRDTLLLDFATLTLRRALTPRQSPTDERYPEFEGTLVFRSNSYPVYFQLLANPERVVQQQGPQAFMLLQTNFAVGSRTLDPAETFLTNLGLLGDNYSVELVAGQPTMVWRGLNRGVSRIELRK